MDPGGATTLKTEAHPGRQALIVWCVFVALNLAINGTIPFVLGQDMRAWSASPLHSLLYGFVQYGIMFLVVPLILIKGWGMVRQPAFLIPLCAAVAAITLWAAARGIAALAVLALAFLHRRFDLSGYGIRSSGWKGDALAVLFVAFLAAVPAAFGSAPPSFDLRSAVPAGLDRWFANPAATVENLFYFGFVAQRFSRSMPRWGVPIVIGAMYTAHEMSNPEYWYVGMNFILTFIGIALFAAIYLWRRSVVPIWLGDGLGRLIGRLL